MKCYLELGKLPAARETLDFLSQFYPNDLTLKLAYLNYSRKAGMSPETIADIYAYILGELRAKIDSKSLERQLLAYCTLLGEHPDLLEKRGTAVVELLVACEEQLRSAEAREAAARVLKLVSDLGNFSVEALLRFCDRNAVQEALSAAERAQIEARLLRVAEQNRSGEELYALLREKKTTPTGLLFAIKHGLLDLREVEKALRTWEGDDLAAMHTVASRLEELLREVSPAFSFPHITPPSTVTLSSEFSEHVADLEKLLNARVLNETLWGQLANLARNQRLALLKLLLAVALLRHAGQPFASAERTQQSLITLVAEEECLLTRKFLLLTRLLLSYLAARGGSAVWQTENAVELSEAAELMDKAAGLNEEETLQRVEAEQNITDSFLSFTSGEHNPLALFLLRPVCTVLACASIARRSQNQEVITRCLAAIEKEFRGCTSLSFPHLVLNLGLETLLEKNQKTFNSLLADSALKELRLYVLLDANLAPAVLSAESNAPLLSLDDEELRQLKTKYDLFPWFRMRMGVELLQQGSLRFAFDEFVEALNLPEPSSPPSLFPVSPASDKVLPHIDPRTDPRASVWAAKLALSQGKCAVALQFVKSGKPLTLESADGPFPADAALLSAFSSLVEFCANFVPPSPPIMAKKGSYANALKCLALAHDGQFSAMFTQLRKFLTGEGPMFSEAADALSIFCRQLRLNGNKALLRGKSLAAEVLRLTWKESSVTYSHPFCFAISRLAANFNLTLSTPLPSSDQPLQAFNAFLLGNAGVERFDSAVPQIALFKLLQSRLEDKQLLDYVFNCHKDHPTAWLLLAAVFIREGNRAAAQESYTKAKEMVVQGPASADWPRLTEFIEEQLHPPQRSPEPFSEKLLQQLRAHLAQSEGNHALNCAFALWLVAFRNSEKEFFDIVLPEEILPAFRAPALAQTLRQLLAETKGLELSVLEKKVRKLLRSVPVEISESTRQVLIDLQECASLHEMLELALCNARKQKPVSSFYALLAAPSRANFVLSRLSSLRGRPLPVPLPSTNEIDVLCTLLSALHRSASPCTREVQYALCAVPHSPFLQRLIRKPAVNNLDKEVILVEEEFSRLFENVEKNISPQILERAEQLARVHPAFYAPWLGCLYRAGEFDAMEELLTRLANVVLPPAVEACVNYYVLLFKLWVIDQSPTEEKPELEEDLQPLCAYFESECCVPAVTAAAQYQRGLLHLFIAAQRNLNEGMRCVQQACLRNPTVYLPRLRAVRARLAEFSV